MSFHDYLEKQRTRPEHERMRIALAVTFFGFFVFGAIWIFSLKEMNEPAETSVDPTSASFNDLKNDFQQGRDSIQDMMQQLPSQTAPNMDDLNTNNSDQAPADDSNNNIQDSQNVPQLP